MGHLFANSINSVFPTFSVSLFDDSHSTKDVIPACTLTFRDSTSELEYRRTVSSAYI